MFRLTAATALLAAAFIVGAHAQETERYQIERTEDGYVRLDTQTGRMSICREQGTQLACRFAAEESAAYEDRIDALEARIEQLEEQLAGRSELTETDRSLPSEDEFEQGLSYMERFMRRFFGLVQEFEREEPMPDRT